MDPKQTAAQGGLPGGQEGQSGQPQSASGAVSGVTSSASATMPVFGSGTTPQAGTPGASATTAGQLGAETLSTGANVSRTMASLNDKTQSRTSRSLFQKKKFDKVVPVTGDIIISSNPEQVREKGQSLDKAKMIKVGGILAGIVAVVLIGAIIFALVAGGGKKKETPVAVSNSVQSSFDEYASYALYGDTDSEINESEISIINSYVIKSMAYSSTEESKIYFDEAKNYLDNFIDTYNGTDLSSQSDFLGWYVPYYRQVFEFVNNCAHVGGLDLKTLLPIYLLSGTDGLDAYFEENYGIFNDPESDLIESNDYYIYQKGVLDYQKKYIQTAQRSRCISGSEIVASCNITMSDEDILLYENSSSSAMNEIGLAVDKIIMGIKQIGEEVNNPTLGQDDEDVVSPDGVGPNDIMIELNVTEVDNTQVQDDGADDEQLNNTRMEEEGDETNDVNQSEEGESNE